MRVEAKVEAQSMRLELNMTDDFCSKGEPILGRAISDSTKRMRCVEKEMLPLGTRQADKGVWGFSKECGQRSVFCMNLEKTVDR